MKTNRHIEIVEHLNLEFQNLKSDALSLLSDMMDSSHKPSLKAMVDATHSGRLTNLRVYPGKFVKAGVDSWLKPTPKPVLKHHKDDLDPVGRVFSAEFIQTKFGTEFDRDFTNPAEKGSGFIKLGIRVMDADTIEKVLDGRFKNVSTRQSSDALLCSVCGENFLSDSECDHMPGKTYKDEGSEYKCYAITGPLEYKEVSFVNIPADSFAEVVNVNMDRESPIMRLNSYDRTLASVGSLVLTDGEHEVSLLPALGKDSVTARDRKKLTGKTIIAVSPNFSVNLLESLGEPKEEIDMSKTKEADKAETKNTSTSAASADASTPAQAAEVKDSKEGVVAPASVKTESTTQAETSTLSDGASTVVIEALTKQLKIAEADTDSVKAEVERLKTTLKDKDAEIEKMRKDSVTVLADLRKSYATNLLSTQLILKKPTVAAIADAEAFSAKLNEYAERSVDSLKDSISDLTPELLSFKEMQGVKKVSEVVADSKVTSPVANITPDMKDEAKDKVKEPTKAEALENYLN